MTACEWCDTETISTGDISEFDLCAKCWNNNRQVQLRDCGTNEGDGNDAPESSGESHTTQVTLADGGLSEKADKEVE